MIEKFLIRFCASEVRLMITRLHERPDDFTYGSMWRDIAMSRDGYTWVERKVLAKEWAKFKKGQKRRELLGLITKEVLDPTPKDRWGLASHSNFQALQGQQTHHHDAPRYQMQMAQMQNQYAGQYASQYNDPRALFQGGNRNV